MSGKGKPSKASPTPYLLPLPDPPEGVDPDKFHGELSGLSRFQGVVLDGTVLYAAFAQKPSGATKAAAEKRARDHRPKEK